VVFKKEIYLIRHGETEYNKKGIVQGSGIDADLNETGRQQAKAFFQKYKSVPFQKVYTSALIRTHQTVRSFLENDVPHEIIPELNEISWGIKEGIEPTDADNDYYAYILKKWQEGETHVPVEGGESPEEVVKRLEIGLEKILKTEDENLVLVAMHGRAMRILLTMISKKPLSEMDTFPHQNTCLYKLVYDYETENFEIEIANDTSHFEFLGKTADEELNLSANF
jgi:probable phosphoglycerate mutase